MEAHNDLNKRLHLALGRCWHEPALQMCHQAPNTGSALCGEKHWYCKKCGNETSGDPGGNGGSRGRYYSTSISDAMEAVGVAIRDKGMEFTFGGNVTGWRVRCGRADVFHEKPETAITLALIEALEAK